MNDILITLKAKLLGSENIAISMVLFIMFLFAGTTQGQVSRVDYEDGTGTIRIRVKTCQAVQSQQEGSSGYQVAETSCGADEEDNEDGPWAMVGGGADICCNSKAHFARNAPDTDELWYARSVDLSGGPSHQLRPYIVLMQLIDEFGVAFRPYTHIEDDNSNICNPDAAGICISEGRFSSWGGTFDNLTLIGGGSQIIPEGGGLGGLIESRPLFAESGELIWRSGAKLHPDDISIRAWIIGIELCPEEWGGPCLSLPRVTNLVSEATSGRNIVNSTIPSSWIPTSVGGQVIAQGNDVRYLEDIIPLDGANRGLRVESKSGDVQNSGATLGAAIVIGKAGAAYQFNAIRFNTAGTALYRHPSSNDLWQTSGYPLDNRGHWHLDPINGTEYLVKNGNPDEGFECAYWDGGNNVRVTNCQESDNRFRWSKIGDNVFQLQNAASSTCLDNGDQGFVSSSLTVENCNTGYSPEQSLFLDAYDWPSPNVGLNEKTFQLEFVHSGKCLDAFNTYSGSNVGQWDCHGGDNQKWKFNPKGSQYFEVVDVRDNLCLEVEDGSNNIQVAVCDGEENQRFLPLNIAGNQYHLQNKASGLLLDVDGVSQNNEANVIEYLPNGGNNQKIIFTDVSSPGGFVCQGACLSATPLSSGTNAVLNTTGERWYVVSEDLDGWQASEMAGRTIQVNGVTVSPGQMPLPPRVNGNLYFHFSAGTHSWASWGYWNF